MTQISAETPPPSTSARPPWYAILAVVSIAFNLIILIILLTVRGMVGNALITANHSLYQTLGALESAETYTIDLNLSEDVQLDNSEPVLFENTVAVPIKTTVVVTQIIPFQDQIVIPINTTVPINKVIQAPLDIAGSRVYIPVPIDIVVPINTQVTVPIDTEVPISLDIPLDFDFDVAINELIPLTNRNGDPLTITLDFDTQVEIPIADIMRDINLPTTLSEIHRALNIIEAILLLPTPEEAPPTVTTAQR